MAVEQVIHCPNCSLQITISAVDGPSQVTCPTCFHRSLVAPGQEPVEPAESHLEEFNRLPEPIIKHTQVAKPATSKRIIRRAARRAHKDANRESIRKARNRMLQTTALILLALTIVGTALFYGYRALRKVPKDSWAEFVPGMESPDKLLSEHAKICESFRETCESIDDDYSRDQAIPRIRVMAARLHGFPSRLAEMGPLSPTQYQSLDPNFLAVVAKDLKQTQDSLRAVRSKRLLYSADLFQALQDFSDESEAAAEAIMSQWKTSPDAETPPSEKATDASDDV